MLVKDIVNHINKLLSNNTSFKLSYDRLKFYLDSAVDDINREMLTDYPTIQELYDSARGYYYMLSLGNTVVVLDDNKDYYYDDKTMLLYYKDNKVVIPDIENLYSTSTGETFYIDTNTELYTSDEDVLYFDEQHTLNDNYLYRLYPAQDIPAEVNINVDYVAIPDRYIRSCVVYGAVCNYLEEEDELEGQYKIYKSRVDREFDSWKKQYYSMYECRW